MKEMEYKTVLEQIILYSGRYNNHKFFIISLGSHPVAYVECLLEDCKDYDDERLNNISVHGGFTFCDKPYWEDNPDKIYLGWDYAHDGDYYYNSHSDSQLNCRKKWTTSEIFEEVMRVIDQLEKIEKIEKNIIKNCPCCGGEASLNTISYGNEEVQVVCKRCHLSTPYIPASIDYSAKEKAIKIWNKRI